MMRRIVAGIAALLLTLGAGWALLAGVASAQPSGGSNSIPGTMATKYQSYAKLVETHLDDLCPTSSGESDGEEESTPAGQASPGLGGSDAGKCTGPADPKLWEAVEACYDKDKRSEDVDKLDDKEFLECMAGKGFGEEPEKDEEEASAEAEEAMANLSLARLSASLTSFYVNQLSPIGGDEAATDDDKEKKTEAKTGLQAWSSILSAPGSAGSFVGSPDRTKQESTNWLFSASDAANVSSVNYAAFNRSDSDDAPDRGVEGYLAYGAMLQGMGFDTTLTDDGGATASRNLYGLAMMAGYAGAGFVDVMFDSVVSVLQWLNPFRFMVDAVTEHTNPTFTEGMDRGAEEPSGALDGLREFFGDLYGVMVDIGWMITIPAFIAMTLLSLLLMKRSDNGSKMKALAIRVAFLVVGIPLLGTSYTAALDAMKGAGGDAGSAYATKVVLSTYVDFEGWVNGPRLQPPTAEQSGNEFWWNLETNAPNSPTAAVARKIALNINAGLPSRPWSTFSDNEVSKRLGQSDATWASDMTAAPEKQRVDADVDDGKVFTATMELINKYRQGTTVSAGAFESSIKAGLMDKLNELKGSPNEAEAKATIASWFTDLSSPESLGSMTTSDIERLHNPLIEVSPGASFEAGHVNEGTRVITFTRGASSGECSNETVISAGYATGKPWDGTKESDPRTACNMAPLAMFNYLNSSFGPTSMDVYTPGQTTSSWARESHASVSAIGSGPAQFMYWFSAMTLLASFALIGLMYALSMMFGVIKRTIQLIGAIPFATMGFMAGIAKVIVYTVAMFLEILGTILVYKIMQELMVVIPGILERPIAERLADGVSTETQVGAASAASGVVALIGEGNLGTVVLIITAISSAGVIAFTKMALSARRALLDGMDRAVTAAVNKFLDTQVSPGMEPGQPGAIRQGVARGAGMAMTGTAMSMVRGDGDGADAASAGGDIAVDSDGTAGDGGGNGNPGVPGAGDGATSIDKDGGLLDAAGNPVMGAGGQQLTAADMMPVDAQGQVTDGSGSPILGADGSPLEADDVAGFDGDGRLLGEDGNPLLDANGNELTSQPASALASQLAGDRTLAAKVLGQGGLSSLDGALGPNQNPGVPVVSQSEPQAPVPTTPSGVPRRVPGQLHSDAVANGEGPGLVQQAAIMSATSVASQRLAGGRRSRAPEAMQVRGGKGGGGGGGGGTGATGGPPRRRTPGVVSTGMTSAATAAMMHQGGQSSQGEGTPGEGTARPPRS
ncbi:hypothetical protein [Gordonia paraffinivorans]|uniref:hypothetical protein n=1 Tax=Gordonia paraffinivorans TaxID=175628 RepID=UPI001E4AFE43|nr:hypothetical protein [Gordonia paraffinivorans]MCD2143716.1 hypothetical protein [Gordonia paraffinivorans]